MWRCFKHILQGIKSKKISAVNAIDIATKKQNLANKVKVYTRNLKTNPLSSFELQLFDVIIIDPPRSGAQSQFVNIAKSQVPLVISISCNINSFIRNFT